MYAGGFKQVLYKESICWIQVKIHISDQTSLRICNSVVMGGMWRSERLHDYYMTAGCGGRCGDLNAFMIIT
jgi:hypothetical protein